MIKLPITFDDLTKRKKYSKEKPYSTYLNCHIGHRKLLGIVLEFLMECQKNEIDLDNSFIIYVGSAPGISINVIDVLFPKLEWILYDSNELAITNLTNKIYHKKYFTDDEIDVAKNAFKKSGKKHFLFISDIRGISDDENIYEDLIIQQRWIINLNCEASSLKFRMPYVMDSVKEKDKILNDIKAFEQMGKSNIKIDNAVIDDYKNHINEKMLYLDGKIFIQSFAPMTSTETRLISFSPYKMKCYDIDDYDEKMFHFNAIDRVKTDYEYEDSKKHLFINNYDEVREYQILYDYNKLNEKFRTINKFYDLIYSIFNKYAIHNMYSCRINMFLRYVNRINNNTDKTMNKYFKYIFDNTFIHIKELIEKINEKIKHKELNNIKLLLDDKIFKYSKNNEVIIDMDLIKAIQNKLSK